MIFSNTDVYINNKSREIFKSVLCMLFIYAFTMETGTRQDLPKWFFCWVCAKCEAYELSLYTRFEELSTWTGNLYGANVAVFGVVYVMLVTSCMCCAIYRSVSSCTVAYVTISTSRFDYEQSTSESVVILVLGSSCKAPRRPRAPHPNFAIFGNYFD